MEKKQKNIALVGGGGAGKALRNAALVASAVLGRFGATKDNSPESFMPGVDIQGTGRGKRVSRHSFKKPKSRVASTVRAIDYLTPTLREHLYKARSRNDQPQIVGSMRGDAWLKENRRLRSAGLRQNRYIAIFDLYVPESSKTFVSQG